MTYETAGSDLDLHVAYVEGQVKTATRHGDELIARARALLRVSQTTKGRRRAEEDARDALAAYASALNWAEDTPAEDTAHANLDETGTWVRRTFGCRLHRNGTTYSQTCPVALGHKRFGFSVGGAAKRICSLCGGDLSECEHQRGTAYLVSGGSDVLGWCRVCLKGSACEHQSNNQYRVSVVAITQEMELDEVSIVAKPAHPDARPHSLTIDLNALREHLGDDFEPGIDVNCDRCLTPCAGLEWFPGLHL